MAEDRISFNQEVDRVVAALGELEPSSPEYKNAVSNLEVLCKARSCKAGAFISGDVIVGAVVNILGILLILNFEQLGVVSSKALGFIRKL